MNWKTFFSRIPEIYIVLAIFFYWYSTALLFNLVAILLLVLFVIHFILKNNTMGLFIGSLFVILSLFMFLALFSDIVKVDQFTEENMKFIFLTSAYLGMNLLMSVIMVIRYSKNWDNKPHGISG